MSLCCESCQVEVFAMNWSLVQRSPTRLWCVVVCDLETSWTRRPWPTGGLLRQKKKKLIWTFISFWCLQLQFCEVDILAIWKSIILRVVFASSFFTCFLIASR